MANELYILSSSPSASPYAIVRRKSDGLVAVPADEDFVEFEDGDITDYAIDLTAHGGDYWSADFPAWADRASYLVLYYRQTGATPTVDDLKIKEESIWWNGAVATAGPGPAAFGTYWTLTGVYTHLGVTETAILSNLSNESKVLVLQQVEEDGAIADAYVNYRAQFGSKPRTTIPVAADDAIFPIVQNAANLYTAGLLVSHRNDVDTQADADRDAARAKGFEARSLFLLDQLFGPVSSAVEGSDASGTFGNVELTYLPGRTTGGDEFSAC